MLGRQAKIVSTDMLTAKEFAPGCRTGMPMNRLVEAALKRYYGALRAGAHAPPIEALRDLTVEGRRG